MRMTLRFALPLLLVLAGVAYGVTQLADKLTLRWFVRDLHLRNELIVDTVEDSLIDLITTSRTARITDLFNRMVRDERLYAIGFCNADRALVYKAFTFPTTLNCSDLDQLPGSRASVLAMPNGSLHAELIPIRDGNAIALGKLVLLHDMSFIEGRSEDTRRYVFYLFAALGVIISLITVAVAQISWLGWVRGLRTMITGDWLLRPAEGNAPAELRPVVRDLRALIREVERERRSRDESQITWTPGALRAILREDLDGDEILIVSNREPYIHNRVDGQVVVQRPASGVVTALEPIMIACSGTWIAHGSGDADRQTVDARGHVAVPPSRPAYRIRRVWLDETQEQGYYYGFSNEGLWPLCHIAHTRPVFRPGDWAHYVAVNEKFARTVAEESKSPDPVVLVQDYHFALLPDMIRRLSPEATVITFWHIPWPNPEAFGICPWAEEILAGLLGSSILGFHTRFHCNNFLDSVDRYLEARVDRETSTITYRGHRTAVKRYPISIDWPSLESEEGLIQEDCADEIRVRHALPAGVKILLGVDRLDYTKGIVERLLAFERLLETAPAWVGKAVMIQIGAPSRSRIPEYRDFAQRVAGEARRINERFARGGYQPVILRMQHVDAPEVRRYYRAADVCVVSSLHDGMNLVAKEYVSARVEETGVLVLSEFTGAARELAEALIINPYHLDQFAGALQRALAMPIQEQRDRMRSMRGLIQEFNVYRWAGRMLLDGAVMRRRSRVLSSAAPASAPARSVELVP